MKDEKLEGLEYDVLVLDHNVHKLTGTVTKLQNGNTGEVQIDEGAIWLVTGLGLLKEGTPDELLQSSLDDTIIVSKSKLIEFISKNK
ncbi:MAG: hypothetical protein AABY15_01875 [Nanoarchaeota archaeon]